MKTSCPFIYADFKCEETVSNVKPFDIRIDCYEDKCPAKMWEPLRCINPSAPEENRKYLGGHCAVIVNICEQCEHLKKCKKSDESRDSCRQDRIDMIFRINNTPPAKPASEPEPIPSMTTKRQYQKSEIRPDVGTDI